METITLAELDGKLQASPFALLDFTTPGCAPCKKISQSLPSLLHELLPVQLAAYEVDVTAEPGIAARFMILGVPALILFKGGHEIARFNSVPKIDTLRRLLS
jgi:thioredoxin-like negative regulator of GroEL